MEVDTIRRSHDLKAIRDNDGDKPFTIHLAKCEDATKYLGPTGDLAKRMMTKLWPGPVAIQFDVPDERRKEVARTLNVPETELYERGTITLRCPDHLITSDVLSEVEGPVVITRAGQGCSSNNIANQSRRLISCPVFGVQVKDL